MNKRLYPLYHGTRAANGREILRAYGDSNKDPFIVSDESHEEWLGSGAYFWEDSLEKAKWWSTVIKKETVPFVLEAAIDVDTNFFLNFDLSENQREFNNFIDEVKAVLEKESLDIVDNTRSASEVDASFAEIIKAYATSKGTKVIKKTFENKNINNTSKGKIKYIFPEISPYYTDTQVCVYDQSVISSLIKVV